MKRTEIIIETRRVTVIQRRRKSPLGTYEAGRADVQIIDVAGGNDCTSANEEFGKNIIQGEENESCTDSRDH
jgi:hypothetical protein